MSETVYIKEKSRKNKYLNEGERYVIEFGLKDGKNPSQIAKTLGRHRSTVIREIKRGMVMLWDSCKSAYVQTYVGDGAHRLSVRRQETKGTGLKIGKDIQTANTLVRLIKDNKWSPDAALGHAKRKGIIATEISTPTLYSYIKSGVLDLTEADLPRKGKQKKRKNQEYNYAKNNLRGTSIEKRPEVVDAREEFGHWEGDLIVGKQKTKTVVLTLVERKTRKVITKEFKGKHKHNIVQYLDYLEKLFGLKFYKVFKSITFDNGSEFLDFENMELSRYKNHLGNRTRIFYAHPYCSSERGSNENANGLLRRGGITKGCNIGLLDKGVVQEATEWVNNLPRKILEYKSANEAWVEAMELLDA